MASTSETGHAQNVANLETLIVYCTSYGAKYNPVKASLQLNSLNALLTSARLSLQSVKAAQSVYANATNVREVIFKQVKPLATKIVNALAATEALKENIDDARSINLKIQGRRAAAIKKPAATAATETAEAEPEVKTASVSQQSYNKQIDNFEHLVHTLAIESNYTPNEEELKVSSLNTLLVNLKSKNSDVINAESNLSNIRISRNDLIYKAGTGLCDVCLDVKNYVKSVFGATSPQFRQVSEIKFTKVR